MLRPEIRSVFWVAKGASSVRRFASAVAGRELILLGPATPFLLSPGICGLLGLSLITVTWDSGPEARDAPRRTRGAGRKKQNEPSGGESLPATPSLHGRGCIGVDVGDKADGWIPLAPDDEAHEAGLEDSQRRVPDLASIEPTADRTPTRSLEETMGHIIKCPALPCESHG